MRACQCLAGDLSDLVLVRNLGVIEPAGAGQTDLVGQVERVGSVNAPGIGRTFQIDA